ncbi:hypothetical protein MTO96_007971 [Rhipicephalus appendiculatus]
MSGCNKILIEARIGLHAHKAPVISIHIIDARGYPIADPFEEEPKGLVPPQRVLICSEEQLKVFTLPSLKPFGKLKLTAHEGGSAAQGRHSALPEPQRPCPHRVLPGGALQLGRGGTSLTARPAPPDARGLPAPRGHQRHMQPRVHQGWGGLLPELTVDLPEGVRPQPPQPQEPQGGKEEEKVEAAAPAASATEGEEPKEADGKAASTSEAKPEEATETAEKKPELSSSAATSPTSPKEESSEGGDDDKGGLDSPPDSGISSLVITKNESNFTTTTSTVGDLKSLELDDLLPADHEALADKLRSECKIEVVREKRTVVVVREETLVNGSSPTN